MLRKVASDMIILFCIAALWASTSRTAMQYVADHRKVDKWWGVFDWHTGNLSGMSHLDFVNRFKSPEDYSGKRPMYNLPRETALYIQGDSHTEHPKLHDTDFAGVSELHFIKRGQTYYYHPDTSKRNVLIIEISESHFRDYFSDLKILDEIKDTTVTAKSISESNSVHKKGTLQCSLLPGISVDLFFNKYINQNLECNLFNYNLFMPLFGCKAAITYYLFKRASGDVVISDDRQFLFYRETVEPTGNGSSFSQLPGDEIREVVGRLNNIYDYYRKDGFREVYLSLLPNTVSVMQPEKYNQLIPMIQANKELKMKIIDVYALLKKNPSVYFLPGDTHWNDTGFLLWLKTVNDTLMNNKGI